MGTVVRTEAESERGKEIEGREREGEREELRERGIERAERVRER